MRRAWLLALVLTVPPLAGFECTIEGGDFVLDPGETCDYFWDADDSRCRGDFIIYCGTDNWVYEADCLAECGGAGTCGYNASFGYNACVCETWFWAPGYSCSYVNNYDDATCSGDVLTYCGEDNVIYDASCDAHCQLNYDASYGTCGRMAETGYNGCNCTWETCTFTYYCYDALWQVYCDTALPDGVGWINCDDQCRAGGSAKGVCDAGSGLCYCD